MADDKKPADETEPGSQQSAMIRSNPLKKHAAPGPWQGRSRRDP